MRLKGRFAPSPSGRMHLGNVYSALMSYLSVKSRGGEWLLRIEDLDRQRCKTEYALQLMDDLRWMGLEWDEGPQTEKEREYFQSARQEIYDQAFERLRESGLIYDCYCRRADILASRAPHATDGTIVYSGRCKNLTDEEREELSATRKPAQRIVVSDQTVEYIDGNYGRQTCNLARDCGDFIIRRADGNYAYQLAVVVDDALMGVNEVVRGNDLIDSTHQQIYLYDKLGYTTPSFYHLPLLMSKEGHRLAKRDQGTDMGYIRETMTPERLMGRLMYWAGQIGEDEAITIEEAVKEFDWGNMRKENIVVEC